MIFLGPLYLSDDDRALNTGTVGVRSVTPNATVLQAEDGSDLQTEDGNQILPE